MISGRRQVNDVLGELIVLAGALGVILGHQNPAT